MFKMEKKELQELRENLTLTITGEYLEKLRGNEVIIYALIYDYCQNNGKPCPYTSRQVATILNISHTSALSTLKALNENGHISKKDIIYDKVRYCLYYIDSICKEV